MKKDALTKNNAAESSSSQTRLTCNQQIILDTLSRQVQPIAAQTLYCLLREKQAIGLATVYRALEVLKLRGLIQSRMSNTGESLYSLVSIDQHHLTCLQCGHSFPLEHCSLQDLETQLQSSLPFKIYYHTLEFFGLCEPCTTLDSEQDKP